MWTESELVIDEKDALGSVVSEADLAVRRREEAVAQEGR